MKKRLQRFCRGVLTLFLVLSFSETASARTKKFIYNYTWGDVTGKLVVIQYTNNDNGFIKTTAIYQPDAPGNMASAAPESVTYTYTMRPTAVENTYAMAVPGTNTEPVITYLYGNDSPVHTNITLANCPVLLNAPNNLPVFNVRIKSDYDDGKSELVINSMSLEGGKYLEGEEYNVELKSNGVIQSLSSSNDSINPFSMELVSSEELADYQDDIAASEGPWINSEWEVVPDDGDELVFSSEDADESSDNDLPETYSAWKRTQERTQERTRKRTRKTPRFDKTQEMPDGTVSNIRRTRGSLNLAEDEDEDEDEYEYEGKDIRDPFKHFPGYFKKHDDDPDAPGGFSKGSSSWPSLLDGSGSFYSGSN